jgi:hypothetical protein
MSRKEKGSRLRMLPPKLQLQQRDALTGSYPTTVRFSTDGRTGNYKINFDDTSVINFSGETSNYLTDYTIHYQRWNESEYMGEGTNGQLFKQTYVGTPYNKISNNQVVEQNNLNPPTNSNWMVLPYGLNNDWPAGEKLFSTLNSIYFDGGVSGDYPETAFVDNDLAYPSVAPDKAFSISVWVYPDNVSGEQPIVSLGAADASSNACWQLLINNGEIELRVYSGLSSQDYIYAITDTGDIGGAWQNVTVTYDGSGDPNNIRIYYGALNGASIEQTKTTGTIGTFVSSDFDTESIRFAKWVDTTGTTLYSGYISEFIYIGKELTSDEVGFVIRAVYNKTSIISYRENGTPVSQLYYNMPGIGLPNSSIWLKQPDAQDLIGITGSTINTWGNITSQVIGGLPFIHYTPGQELTPFRDNDQPAVDGKSQNNPFFTTGSSVLEIGEGFSSPLWSKNKIEIDISVATPCSATLFLSGVNWSTATRPEAETDGKSYEMCYYNFTSKTWQGAGTGTPYGFFHDAVNHGPSTTGRAPFEDRIMFGFAPGIVNTYPFGLSVADANTLKTQVTGVFEWQASAGQPFTNFGFPYHPKYHATGSQTLQMDRYINQPFLLEKIVVELSAAYTIFANTYNTASFLYDTNILNPPVTITSITQSTFPASVNNIFILNQRKPIKFNNVERMEYVSYDPANPLDDTLLVTNVPTTISLSAGGTPEYVSTVRDLITWGGITSFAANAVTSSTRSGTPIFSNGSTPTLTLNPRELMSRDYVFTSSIEAHDDLTPLSWSGKISLELLAKSPIRIDRNVTGGVVYDNMFSSFNACRGTDTGQSSGNFNALKYGGGGRNALGINVPNGRNYVTPIAQIQENGSFINDLTDVNYDTILVKDENRYRYNPYILFPTDELIIGWQQPSLNSLVVYGSTAAPTTRGAKNALSGSFSEIKFLPGDAKITLYGSYIREGKEYNDGLNQLLSSDSIHEVIE